MLSDLEKNMEGYSGAVKSVIRRAESKQLGGIHGTLSQLIQVDNEYSTAIVVALGAAMQKYRNRNRGGRQARNLFILRIISSAAAPSCRFQTSRAGRLMKRGWRKISASSPSLPDLVECDKKYKEIISNLLSRVVIVDDMDSGYRHRQGI
jgi:chromosome segregation protein